MEYDKFSMFIMFFVIEFYCFISFGGFVQGYSTILARKHINIQIFIVILICFILIYCMLLLNVVINIFKIKSVKLIKLNMRLQLHHFIKVVGGNKCKSVFDVFCLIDKYLYLIFNLF